MPTFLKSVATKPRSSTFSGSHANLSQLCVATKPRSPTFPGSHANLSQLCVATKPRSPTFPGSHANLSQLCVATKPRSPTLQVLMPMFLSTTVTSRHDARLSSTTHCALRASRINYNLTNLSRCYSFLFFYYGPMQHPAVQPISFSTLSNAF